MFLRDENCNEPELIRDCFHEGGVDLKPTNRTHYGLVVNDFQYISSDSRFKLNFWEWDENISLIQFMEHTDCGWERVGEVEGASWFIWTQTEK